MARRPQTNAENPSQTPEIQLILACTRNSLDQDGTARIRALLQEKLDWERVFSIADPQGVLPLLHWHLCRNADSMLPVSVAERLRQRFHSNLSSNLWLTGELLRILPVFAQHHVPVIPFKGPVLTASLYGHLGLREFGDLDLLVHPGNVLRAKALLLQAGYLPELPLTPTQESLLLRHDCEYNFTSSARGTRVEVHWLIAPRSFSLPLDPDPWWQRLTSFSLNGSAVPMLSAEDLLVVLSVHGGKHCWERLSWVVDVGALLRQYPHLDWKTVCVQARRARARRMLLLGLHLAHELLGAPVPADLLREIVQEPALRSLQAEVQRRWEEGMESRTAWAYLRFVQQTREKPWDRLCQVLGTVCIPTSKEWQWVRLPAVLFPLYVPLRLCRLAGKHTLLRLRKLFGRLGMPRRKD